MKEQNGRNNSPSLKRKFLHIVLLASLPFFISVNVMTFILSSTAQSQIRDLIENNTIALNNVIDAFLKTNVNTYLHSKVEVGVNTVHNTINDNGGVIDKATITEITEQLLALQVGTTGYFYAVDSKGIVQFHPDDNIVGTNQNGKPPVTEQVVRKNGYLEYEWQNTFEPEPRKKALYMTYLPELDWILTATSYRSEFTHMLDLGALRSTIEEIGIGKTGYSYVVNRSGQMIAHPYLEGNSSEGRISDDEFQNIIDKLFSIEEGFTTYNWRDNPASREHEKIVYAKYLKDFDWVVGTAIYLYEINRPMRVVFLFNALFTFGIAVALFFLVRRISWTIETPIFHLVHTLHTAVDGDLSVRAAPAGPAELRELAAHLNDFIETLEIKTNSLSESLKVRENLIREIQHRVRNNLQTITSLLNLQKDTLEPGKTMDIVRNTQNRISGMSIVYDHMLGADADFEKDRLPIRSFFDTYISSILASYGEGKHRVTVEQRIDNIFLRRNTAITCGLIVHEILSRQIVAAVQGGANITLSIEFQHMDNERYSLQVNCSGGNGGEEQSENVEEAALSRRLISVLTEQILGTGDYEIRDCSTYRVEFPDRHI